MAVSMTVNPKTVPNDRIYRVVVEDTLNIQLFSTSQTNKLMQSVIPGIFSVGTLTALTNLRMCDCDKDRTFC